MGKEVDFVIVYLLEMESMLIQGHSQHLGIQLQEHGVNPRDGMGTHGSGEGGDVGPLCL
jgi:hypothetical protein